MFSEECLAYASAAILHTMTEYQEKHNTTKECIANSQIFYNLLSNCKMREEFSVAAVIVAVFDKNNLPSLIMSGHITISLGEDTILEPSYEVRKLKNPIYFRSWKAFINQIPETERENPQYREVLQNFLKFSIYAEQMNRGMFLCYENPYYDSLSNYLRCQLK